MLPFLIIIFGLVVMVLLFTVFFGRYAERGLKLEAADETIATLTEKLEQALDEHVHLRERIENLEAIVTTEAWDDFQRQQLLEPAPPRSLAEALPDEETDAERVARMARQRTV